MGTRKRNQTLLQATLPRCAKDLILFIRLREYGRRYRPDTYVKSKKPNIPFRRYKNYRMLIRLRYWRMTNQARSLQQAQYSNHPRNPE